MKRRNFISGMTINALALSVAPYARAMGENQKGENYGAHPANKSVVTELAGMSLEKMRDFHLNDLKIRDSNAKQRHIKRV